MLRSSHGIAPSVQPTLLCLGVMTTAGCTRSWGDRMGEFRPSLDRGAQSPSSPWLVLEQRSRITAWRGAASAA